MLYNKSMCRFIFTILVAFLLSIFIANPCFAVGSLGEYVLKMPYPTITKMLRNIYPRILGPNREVMTDGSFFKLKTYTHHNSLEEIRVLRNKVAIWHEDSAIQYNNYKDTHPALAKRLFQNKTFSNNIYNEISPNGLEHDQKIFVASSNTNTFQRDLTMMKVQIKSEEAEAKLLYAASEPDNLIKGALSQEGAIKGAGKFLYLETLSNIEKNNPNIQIITGRAVSDEAAAILYKIGFFRTESIDMCAEDRSYVNTNTSIPKPTK